MFKFYGAKRRLAPQYPAPQLRTIVEPFAGAAGYAVHHRRSVDRVILVERDDRVADLWVHLLGLSTAEILARPTPTAGEWCDDLLVAFAAGRTTRDTPALFRVTERMAARFDPMIRHLAEVIDDCRHFEVVHGDYRDAPDIEATWFIDPPYQAGAGRWDRTRGGRYTHSNRDIDFSELSDWVQARRGQVIACDQEGADWLPWNGRIATVASSKRSYDELYWHRPSVMLPVS
ncbi:hypothetical protein [Leucobacter sp. cx-169]|uniref:hypothetical protein n=1 Tax=Leucobacter sp. cx-169 TaxID=2770549 RepID=UPI00165E5D57|nr:hypothetical protein [Leucobacter sp. cx-169]MBC9927288.1 hypothetical protein [Leucobacter sp. cx-169]